jgi:aspartate aminotransferase
MPRHFAERLAAFRSLAPRSPWPRRRPKLRAEGHKVFPFSVGEPDFDTPAHIRAAVKAALDAGATHYTPVTRHGRAQGRHLRGHRARPRLPPEPGEIVVSCGAKHALFNLALALYEPGDEVLIPAPYWVSYPEQVRIVGATPGDRPDQAKRRAFASARAPSRGLSGPRTKAVILCTPSNPTGAAYDRGRTSRPLLDVLRGHDCWIIVDEIYADLVYDGFVHSSPAPSRRTSATDLIVVDGVSKTFAMTGLAHRLDHRPEPALTKGSTIQSQSTTNAAAVSQAAAAALLGPARRAQRHARGLRPAPRT